MTKALINFNVTSKQELDEILQQYQNGGKALRVIDDFQDVLRNSRKHGYEMYLEEINRRSKADQLAGYQKAVEIDAEVLSTIASACLEYFRDKFFEAKQDNGVEDC